MKQLLIALPALILAAAAQAQTPTPPIGASPEALLATPDTTPPREGSAAAQALTTLIAGLQSGQVNYRRLRPAVVNFIRRQQPRLTIDMRAKGELQTIEDRGVQENGLRAFTVVFANDRTDFAVALDRRGRIAELTLAD